MKISRRRNLTEVYAGKVKTESKTPEIIKVGVNKIEKIDIISLEDGTRYVVMLCDLWHHRKQREIWFKMPSALLFFNTMKRFMKAGDMDYNETMNAVMEDAIGRYFDQQ